MISKLFIYFVITGIIGYIYECIAMTVWSGKWDNRGFLFGPMIPIYGVGCLCGLAFGNIIEDYTMLQVFLAGFLASAILEYPTSYIMEKVFHERWWDYSIAPINIQGRVSLLSSLGFGIAAVVIVYVINDLVVPLVWGMDPLRSKVLGSVLAFVFVTDFVYSVYCSKNNIVPHYYDKVNDSMGNMVERINPKGRNLRGFLVSKTGLFK